MGEQAFGVIAACLAFDDGRLARRSEAGEHTADLMCAEGTGVR